ncbi:unnamed protein product [Caenorhabditis nigoni]
MAAQVEEEETELDDEEGAHGSWYNVPNRECSGEDKCRIPLNAEFMGLIKRSRNGKEYCMECFAVEDRRIQKTLYMKKRNELDKVLDEGVEKQRIKKYQDFGEKKIKRIEDLPLFIYCS